MNKNIIIGILVVVVVLVAASYYLYGPGASTATPTTAPTAVDNGASVSDTLEKGVSDDSKQLDDLDASLKEAKGVDDSAAINNAQ